MKISRYYVIFSILATLFGCAAPLGTKEGQAQIVNTATVFDTKTAVVTEVPTRTETLAPTVSLPTLETVAPPTSTFTPQEPAWLRRDCFQMVSSPPEDTEVRGKIILMGDSIYSSNARAKFYEQLTAYDVQMRKYNSIPPDKSLTLSFSPDGKHYAAIDATNGKTMVYSHEGRLINAIPPGSTPWHIDHWLDNQTIAFVIDKPIPGLNYDYYPRDVVIFNPFTNQQRRFPSQYPDIDKTQSRLFWEGGGTTQYDASLTRVIYPGTVKVENSNEARLGYILWDLINQKKLAEMSTDDFLDTPKWSPDQSKFIVNSRLEGNFYLVTRDGKVSKITNFNPDRANKIKYSSNRYSWSPDGKRVVLWLESRYTDRTVSASLALLDIESGEILDTCISAGVLEGGELFETDVPIWSPDGQYLTVKVNRQENKDADVLIVDLKNSRSYKIDETLSPAGWLYGGDSK